MVQRPVSMSVLPHSGHCVIRLNGGALMRFHASLPEGAV